MIKWLVDTTSCGIVYKVCNLCSSTKQLIIDVIRAQSGDTLSEVLRASTSQDQVPLFIHIPSQHVPPRLYDFGLIN